MAKKKIAPHTRFIKESKNGADQLRRSEQAQNIADVLILFLVSLTTLTAASLVVIQLSHVFRLIAARL